MSDMYECLVEKFGLPIGLYIYMKAESNVEGTLSFFILIVLPIKVIGEKIRSS